MSRTLFSSILILVAAFAACVDEPVLDAVPTGAGEVETAAGRGLVVDRVRAGDRFVYDVAHSVEQLGESFTAAGSVEIVVADDQIVDGFGMERPVKRVEVQVDLKLDGGETERFVETSWITPDTQTQIREDFEIAGQDTNSFPMEPLAPIPVRRSTVVQSVGTIEDYAPNPLGRGAVMFGLFAGNRTLVEGGSFEFIGLLMNFGNFTAQVKELEASDGSLVESVTVDARQGDDMMSAAVMWKGDFAADCPLPRSVVQNREWVMGGQAFIDTLDATLRECVRGPAASGTVPNSPEWPARRAGDYVDWQRLPPDGNGAQLRFPLSEMFAALNQHPTASQYLAAHPGAYLQSAFLEEVNTCPVYTAASPPSCHWDTWRGFFQDPDKTQLHFTVERYSNDDGTGVAYVPVMEREYPFNEVFSVGSGQPPPLPPGLPQVVSVTQDVPSRDTFSDKTFPMSAAIGLWQETAQGPLASARPNFASVWLEPDGYSYFLSYSEWVYPDPAPIFPLYNDGLIVVDRHVTVMFGDGYNGFNVDLEIDVDHS